MKKRGRGLRIFLVLVLIAGAIFAVYKLLSVQNIAVYGLVNKTADEVIALSGISRGESMFFVDTDRARASLLTDPFLEVQSVLVEFPTTVRIDLRERQIRAAVQFYRNVALIDEYGFVLETMDVLQDDLGIPVVGGLSVGTLEVGREVDVLDKTQLIAMQVVLDELDKQGLTASAREVNVANLDSLVVFLRNGLEVQLGDRQEMESKIRWVTVTLPQLTAEGNVAGVLNVSSAKYADFLPSETQPSSSQEPEDGLDDTSDDAGDDNPPEDEGGEDPEVDPDDPDGEEDE